MSHSGNSHFRLIATLGLIAGLVPMAVDMYLPGVPAIAEGLATDTGRAQQVLSVFLFGLAVAQLFYGPLSDRYGRKGLLLIGIAIYALASGLSAFAQTIDQLLALRLAQALGAASAGVIMNALVRDLYQGDEAVRVLSFTMVVMTLAPLLAPFIGGYILLWFSWRVIFVVMSLYALVTMVAVFVFLNESLTEKQRQPLSVQAVAGSYYGVLRHRQAMGYNLSMSLAFAAMFAFLAGSPFVYIEYFGLPAEHYGYLFGCNILVMMAVAFINGRLVGRIKGRYLLALGLSVQLVASVLLVINSYFGLGGLVGVVIPVVLVVGFVGMISANATSYTMGYFHDSAGTASAVIGTTRFLMGGLAAAAVGWFHNGSIMVMPIIMLICTALALLVLLFTDSSRQ